MIRGSSDRKIELNPLSDREVPSGHLVAMNAAGLALPAVKDGAISASVPSLLLVRSDRVAVGAHEIALGDLSFDSLPAPAATQHHAHLTDLGLPWSVVELHHVVRERASAVRAGMALLVVPVTADVPSLLRSRAVLRLALDAGSRSPCSATTKCTVRLLGVARDADPSRSLLGALLLIVSFLLAGVAEKALPWSRSLDIRSAPRALGDDEPTGLSVVETLVVAHDARKVMRRRCARNHASPVS